MLKWTGDPAYKGDSGAENWATMQHAKSNLRDSVLGELEKKSCCFARQRGTQQTVASKTVCPNPAGFGEEFYSGGSRAELLIRIRVCPGPALLQSGLGWSPDELLWFSTLSNHDLLSGMKIASSSSSSSICWGF